MPPPNGRGFANGPTNVVPFHQAGFPAHSQSAGRQTPLGASQYMNSNRDGMPLNPFSSHNGNGFALPSGLNGNGFGSEGGFAGHGSRMPFAHHQAISQQPHAVQQQHNALQQRHSQNSLLHDQQAFRQAQLNVRRIRDVWAHNLHEEMAVLRDLTDKYPYIAMDTEFPGVVARPMGAFRGKSDYHYQCLRTNVDLLKVIQIGISLFDEDGEPPPLQPNVGDSMDVGASGRRNGNQGQIPLAWQFNFKFSLKDDMYNEKSIESLQAAGIDFAALARDGIDHHEFASLLIPSGLVCFDNVRWISFHGGYDYGYLTKLLYCLPLPNDESDFDQIMKRYFPSTYDVKHLMKHAIKLHNNGLLTPVDPTTVDVLQKFEHRASLENTAETFKIKRLGTAHQAGSDCLLTGKVFFELREKIFNGEIAEEHLGKVWGLGVPDFGLLVNQAPGSGVDSTPGQASSNGAALGQNGTPSTPNIASVGLATTTPSAQTQGINGLSVGPMTPGGGGGVFGSFAFSGGSR